jgi:hypothetical protein
VAYHTNGIYTELDVLDTFATLKVAVAYKDPETGNELDYFPADLGYLERCDVVYKEFEGWQTSTTAVKTFVCPSVVNRQLFLGSLLTQYRVTCRGKRRPMSSSLRSSLVCL